MKTYRGSPAAARHYVEADRSRADDYYLAEGTGMAQRYAASPDAAVRELAPLTGDKYEAWVAGFDLETSAPKGRLRNDENAVRFVEVIVNGPKSWSLAAELYPDISAAYDAAQDAAARQIIAWLAQHATTRVGARGAQVQVPVSEIEAVTVRHYTSRAGDPHRHLHLQINARVLAEGVWRGLHTVGVRDSVDAINGIGHGAVMTDPGFREALVVRGFTLDPNSGEVQQLAEFVGPFSARAAQIARNIDRYEHDWRAAHPGQEPGQVLRRSWDARAWADARPDKVVPRDGAELTQRWVAELHALGYRERRDVAHVAALPVGRLDRDAAVTEVLARLATRRSGWNAADIRGEVEQLIARRNIVTDASIRSELAEDLTARTHARCVPLLDREGVPEHIRALTSPHVLDVEADLTGRLAARASAPSCAPIAAAIDTSPDPHEELDIAQQQAVRVLAGDAQLVVIEGAAGAGKTTTLTATRTAIEHLGGRLVVVTPTLKAAQVAARELGTRAHSAAWLAHQHGYRWHLDGSWTRLHIGQLDPHTGVEHAGPSDGALLRRGDLLLVDEAGMADQDTARALLTIVDEHGARLVLVGDQHQLPAVGRGGVLDLAARWAHPDACLTLDTVHRFTRTTTRADGTTITVADEGYAQLSLAMRTGANPDDVFDALLARDQIRVYDTEAERTQALVEQAVEALAAGAPAAVVADTREQVAALNAAVRDRLVQTGRVDDTHATTTNAGQRIGVGDRVVTRRNDRELRVANRDTWTVTHVATDGSVTLTGVHGARALPAGYVRAHVELGYASTVHGIQGDTTSGAHVAVGEHSTAASAYVGMTRGRELNVAHLVAVDLDDARDQWCAVFGRDRADLGPAHAAEAAAREASRYAQLRPLEQILAELHRAWTAEQDSLEALAALERRRDLLTDVVTLTRDRDAAVPALKQGYVDALLTAERAATRADTLEKRVAAHAGQLTDAMQQRWDDQRDAARHAAQIVHAGPGRLGQRQLAVRRATEELARWSTAWQPYLPAMPTRTSDVAVFAAGWLADSPRIREAFEQHARTAAEHAAPEHHAAHADAETAARQRDRAWRAWQDTRAHYDLNLSNYGQLAHHRDPAGYLAETEHSVTATRGRLDTAQERVTALLAEPTLRALPAERITAEREAWRAARDDRAAEQAQRVPYRAAYVTTHEHDFTPSPAQWQPAPAHSHGISR